MELNYTATFRKALERSCEIAANLNISVVTADILTVAIMEVDEDGANRVFSKYGLDTTELYGQLNARVAAQVPEYIPSTPVVPEFDINCKTFIIKAAELSMAAGGTAIDVEHLLTCILFTKGQHLIREKFMKLQSDKSQTYNHDAESDLLERNFSNPVNGYQEDDYEEENNSPQDGGSIIQRVDPQRKVRRKLQLRAAWNHLPKLRLWTALAWILPSRLRAGSWIL